MSAVPRRMWREEMGNMANRCFRMEPSKSGNCQYLVFKLITTVSFLFHPVTLPITKSFWRELQNRTATGGYKVEFQRGPRHDWESTHCCHQDRRVIRAFLVDFKS
ncbi:hypothetical protein CISG_00818 [Coccidioides immitis RMSCC 3703]|uniref:Uncharacterized protein n=1 Tax=Coccidioides immitis RMSCC 3703 TaxID=454286 RepID=A0A0J8QUE1_COCIT|nr:hypothetical protein CISG_00818 [Coccidioides immitis RMSCC 3703]